MIVGNVREVVRASRWGRFLSCSFLDLIINVPLNRVNKNFSGQDCFGLVNGTWNGMETGQGICTDVLGSWTIGNMEVEPGEE